MKRHRLLVAITYIVTLGICGAMFGTSRVLATAIPNTSLDNLSSVRTYLSNNQPYYLTYVKGGSILYHPNAGSDWDILTNDTNKVTLANRPDHSNDEKAACVNIIDDRYTFQTTFRSNIGSGCGAHAAHKDDLTYEGGRVNIDPPDNLPVAVFITDIDSAYNDWQRIYFDTGAIKAVYTPNDGAKFDYSSSEGRFSTTGSGECFSASNAKCNAAILLLGASYNVKVSMRSEDGYMKINNNVISDYRTLAFNLNGGTVPDDQNRHNTVTLWEHSSTDKSYRLREYKKGARVGYFPIPTRDYYIFDGWYSDSPEGNGCPTPNKNYNLGDGPLDSIDRFDLDSDCTLTAHWHSVPQWTISGSTTVSSSDASGIRQPGNLVYPEQTVTFAHTVTNSGPDATLAADNSDVNIYTDTYESFDGTTYTSNLVGGHSVGKIAANGSVDAAKDYAAVNKKYIPLDWLNGYKYCQRVGYAPYAYNAPAYPNDHSNGTGVCVTVQYDYNLTPVVSGPSVVGVGETGTFTTSVTKDVRYYSNPTDWSVLRIVLPAGTVLPAEDEKDGRSGSDPALFSCAYYTSKGAKSCGVASPNGSGTSTFKDTSTLIGGINGEFSDIANESMGSRICYALIINSASQASKPNFKTIVKCAIVAKYPALEVLNGEVRTGGALPSTGLTCTLSKAMKENDSDGFYSVLMHNYNSASRGSYGQYGALALGRIANYGSGGMPFRETILASKLLLFGSSGTNGFFYSTAARSTTASTFCMTNVASMFPVASEAVSKTDGETVDISGLDGAVSYHLDANATLNLTAPASYRLPAGKRIVIHVSTDDDKTATVRLTSNIRYQSAGYTAASQLPEFVLIGDKGISLQIANTVTEVRGIYSVNGNIYTCDDYDGSTAKPMDASQCNQHLEVKGVLQATGRILPYRTYGYDTVTNVDAAETFNLAPETLIGDYDRASELPTLTTSYQKEVPTRL